jgi:CcmD family protein
MNKSNMTWRVAIVLAMLAVVVAIAVGPVGAQPPAPAQPGQGAFEPVHGKSPAEQLPAANYVMGAYAVVWVVLLAYVWLLWRRVRKVQKELTDLRRRVEQKA